jgi:hypothetical protein
LEGIENVGDKSDVTLSLFLMCSPIEKEGYVSLICGLVAHFTFFPVSCFILAWYLRNYTFTQERRAPSSFFRENIKEHHFVD